jgi:biotin synthase-like enzyme
MRVAGKLSSMSAKLIDGSHRARLAELGERVLGGGDVTREEGGWLFSLESREEIFDLLAWANRLREHFKGNKIHLCSIVNVKAGGCSEDCRFCAQSASYETGSPRHDLIDPEEVHAAAAEAKRYLARFEPVTAAAPAAVSADAASPPPQGRPIAS